MTKNLRVKSSKLVDETYRISFKFNGTTYYGFKGDTLASALLANNIHLVGRSFKYHRPRGIMTAGSEEPNAIVQLHNGTSRTEPKLSPPVRVAPADSIPISVLMSARVRLRPLLRRRTNAFAIEVA